MAGSTWAPAGRLLWVGNVTGPGAGCAAGYRATCRAGQPARQGPGFPGELAAVNAAYTDRQRRGASLVTVSPGSASRYPDG